MYTLPESGYLREWHILGDPKAEPPIEPIFPMSRSTWWAGVKSGRYPKPVKLGPRTTAWSTSSIKALMEQLAATGKLGAE